MNDDLLRAFRATLQSNNTKMREHDDADLKPANVVDGLFAISNALEMIAKQIELYRIRVGRP